jgi:hypothetical protein
MYMSPPTINPEATPLSQPRLVILAHLPPPHNVYCNFTSLDCIQSHDDQPKRLPLPFALQPPPLLITSIKQRTSFSL